MSGSRLGVLLDLNKENGPNLPPPSKPKYIYTTQGYLSSPGYPLGYASITPNQIFYLSNNKANGYRFYLMDLDLTNNCEDRLEISSISKEFVRIDACTRLSKPIVFKSKKIKVEFISKSSQPLGRGYKLFFQAVTG